MKFNRSLSLIELAALLESPFKGEEALKVEGINEIHRVEPGDIVFVDHPKYYDKALQSAASVVLINKEVEVPEGKGIVICDDPFRSFNFILNYFRPFDFFSTQEYNTVGKNCQIHPSVIIGKQVSIGDNCIIYPNVVIHDHCKIGHDVIIQSGSVIGSNGFYYKKRPENYDRLLSVGTVSIQDQVEIGANCTIDRGVTAETTIGRGSKLDNLVQIGHDTILGKNCLVAAHTGIAGCVTIGNNVTLWGQVGITSGVTIGDQVVVSAKSGVSKDLESGKTYAGAPAIEFKEKYREMAALRRLPDFIKQKSND